MSPTLDWFWMLKMVGSICTRFVRRLLAVQSGDQQNGMIFQIFPLEVLLQGDKYVRIRDFGAPAAQRQGNKGAMT
jgi:hypothetical protein